MFNIVRNTDKEIVGVEYQGEALSFDPNTKVFDEQDPLVIQLRSWEAENNLNLIEWANRDRYEARKCRMHSAYSPCRHSPGFSSQERTRLAC